MKRCLRLIVLIVCLSESILVSAQTFEFFQTQNYHNQLRLNTLTGEVYQVQDDGGSWLVNSAITPESSKPYRYWLYPTQNMWTFILIDLFTGKLWQTQYSIKGDDYRYSVPINSNALSYSEHAKFEIKPMMSMYQFYLINKDTGEMWKFQWSTKSEDGYRWIEKIN